MQAGFQQLPLVAAVLVCLLCSAGCTQQMANQPRSEPLEPSAFFANGMASRPLVAGTVARGSLMDNPVLETGRNDDGELIAEAPLDITEAVIRKGQHRFAIYCDHCHGSTGFGDGMVVKRGFPQPPSFHSDRLRDVADGHIFDVITNGPGRMPAFGNRIPVEDRWAIAAYIRALQLSQHTPVDELSPSDLDSLQKVVSADQ